MSNSYNGETFLNKVYKELYNSREVLQEYKNPSQKEKNKSIHIFLNILFF